MKTKLLGILVCTLLIATVVILPSTSGKIVKHEVGMEEPTEIYETTYDDILFSDDLNDNIIDYNKRTEIYMSGTWEETNGEVEVQLTELGGGITKIEGPYWFVVWLLGLRMGYYWDVWLSDSVCDNLNIVGLATYLISILGIYGLIVAFAISGHIILITNANEGNGVYFKLLLYVYPFPWLGIADPRPQ